MFKNPIRAVVGATLAAAFTLSTTLALTLTAFTFTLTGLVPASADTSDALTTLVTGANSGIKNAMDAGSKNGDKNSAKHPVDSGTVAQAPPVQQSPVGGASQQGLPVGFTYTADLSMAYPYGNVGKTGKAWLPGGVDLVAGYGFNPTTRIVVNYYELQHYPVAFNSGTVPLYLQGFATPLADVNLASISPQINVTTKDRFTLLMLEKLFTVGTMKGRPIPIVITPTYVSRVSRIAASPSNNDIVPFEPNPPNGFPITSVYTRTAQVWSLAFTAPFLKTPKMFGTFTLAPSTLVHLAGLNQNNHVQLYQILYIEYTPNPGLKFFLEPQSSRDYLPLDSYPQHLMAYFLGASQRIGKQGFVQLILNSGGPSNVSPYGVTALTCQALPCSQNPVIPTIGGLKATQLQIQFGIGSPSVIQF